MLPLCGLITDSPRPPAQEASCGKVPCPDEASSKSPSAPSMRSPSTTRILSSGIGNCADSGCPSMPPDARCRSCSPGAPRAEAGDPRAPRRPIRRRREEARRRRHRPHQARRSPVPAPPGADLTVAGLTAHKERLSPALVTCEVLAPRDRGSRSRSGLRTGRHLATKSTEPPYGAPYGLLVSHC